MFVPHYSELIITTAKLILPSRSKIKIYTRNFGETGVVENDYGDIYEDNEFSTTLSLLHIDGRYGFKVAKQVQIDKLEDLIIKISDDGKYFAIYSYEQCTMKVFDALDISECFQNIEDDMPLFTVDLDQTF